MVDRHRRRRAASPRQHGRGAASGQALSTARSRPARKAPGRARARRPKGQGWRFPRSRATRRCRRTTRAISGAWRWRRWAWSTATSAPARSTRSGRPSARRAACRSASRPCWASLSLIFWSLLLIVTVKYVVLILRADNRGEGGVLALGALAARAVGDRPRLQMLILVAVARRPGAVLRRRADHARDLGALGGRGAGDRHAGARPYVLPLAVVRAGGAVPDPEPRHGLRRRLFGPVMLVWFAVLARPRPRPDRAGTRTCCARWTRATASPCSGTSAGGRSWRWVRSCWRSPGPRRSTPTWATSAGCRSASPGSASCCRRWCSTISARARCCCATRRRSTTRSTIWCPAGLLYPMVGLATLATVIASQAVISGVFSMTRQAIQLGYLPRIDGPPHLGARRSARSTCRG